MSKALYLGIDLPTYILERKNNKTLYQNFYNGAATHIGDYALFGGGYRKNTDGYNTYSINVDAFNTSLTRTYKSFAKGLSGLAATHVGDYALFGGGTSSSSSYESTVYAFNSSLIRTTPTALPSGRENLTATHVGNYAIFSSGGASNQVAYVAYDSSLTMTTLTLISGLRNQASTHVGDYALFAGGYYSGYSSSVEVFDTSLTNRSVSLSEGRSNLAATHVGDYALFGGGSANYTTPERQTVEAFTKTLTRISITDLSYYYTIDLAATHVGDYALFAGGVGNNTSSTASNNANSYDTSLTRSILDNLTTTRYEHAATHIGNYALFGGGRSTNDINNTVDVYEYKAIYNKNTAKLMKHIYAGINNLSKKIRKIYIGVNNIAKEVFDDTIDFLTTSFSFSPDIKIATTHIVNTYALFCYRGDINAFNNSLTISTPTSLSYYLYNEAATHVGDYALFGGGCSSHNDLRTSRYSSVSSGTYYTNVYSYNTSLTKGTQTTLSKAVCRLAATHVGDYALFAGGSQASNGTPSNISSTVNVYSSSLVKSTASSIYQSIDLAATHVGDYALFAGGVNYEMDPQTRLYKYVDKNNIYSYNTSLTVNKNLEKLSISRANLAATHVGDYALFGGGKIYDNGTYYSSTTRSNFVDAYDKSLTKIAVTSLPIYGSVEATNFNNHALFTGGLDDSYSLYHDKILSYNTSLTLELFGHLSSKRTIFGATHFSKYALFGGGYNGISYTDTVDIIKKVL